MKTYPNGWKDPMMWDKLRTSSMNGRKEPQPHLVIVLLLVLGKRRSEDEQEDEDEKALLLNTPQSTAPCALLTDLGH